MQQLCKLVCLLLKDKLIACLNTPCIVELLFLQFACTTNSNELSPAPQSAYAPDYCQAENLDITKFTGARGHYKGRQAIADPANPSLLQTQDVGFELETIFPFGNRLFIGSTSVIHIFSLTNPIKALLVGLRLHILPIPGFDGNFPLVKPDKSFASPRNSNTSFRNNLVGPMLISFLYPSQGHCPIDLV